MKRKKERKKEKEDGKRTGAGKESKSIWLVVRGWAFNI